MKFGSSTNCTCVLVNNRVTQIDTCPAHGVTRTEHDWYHDGTSIAAGGRVCRNCRFREVPLVENSMEVCIGNSSLYDMAFKAGHNTGWRERGEDVKKRMGLA